MFLSEKSDVELLIEIIEPSPEHKHIEAHENNAEKDVSVSSFSDWFGDAHDNEDEED